ncbi:MAG TPA: GNAT family N-acetyltransferase [Thermoplasmata archaeon]|nr:GNAT family N-acetyltransferase [Thermoplasmata archaeon]
MKNRKATRSVRQRITVRPYVAHDLGFVRRLFAEYTETEKRRLRERGLVYAWSFEDRYLRSLPNRTRKGGLFLVATVDGVPAGCVAAIRKPRTQNWSWDATRHPSGLVMELHVATEFRGRGVGRRLMKAAEDHFRSSGSDWLSLGVFPTNEVARVAYRKMGYQDVYIFMGKTLRAE